MAILMCFSGCGSPQRPGENGASQDPERAAAAPLLGATERAGAVASTEHPKPTDWKAEVGDVLGIAGELKDEVYRITVPRKDLDVRIDGMDVPTAAGIASNFYFYRCSCGKVSALGEFIVVDYEANDVIDALRPGTIIRVTAVGPIAIGDKPRLLSVRFHGEGEGPAMAKLIKEALRWTGEERSKPGK